MTAAPETEKCGGGRIQVFLLESNGSSLARCFSTSAIFSPGFWCGDWIDGADR